MSAPSSDSDKVLSAARIAFGTAWFADGLLKWQLIAGGQMKSVVSGFGIGAFTANWYLIGVVVALAETVGGLALALGVFQRVAAIGSATLSFLFWGFTGMGGLGLPAQLDLGGDLMLALAFAVLVFAPNRFGLSSRLGLSRWNLWPPLAVNSKQRSEIVTSSPTAALEVVGLRELFRLRPSPDREVSDMAPVPRDHRVLGVRGVVGLSPGRRRPTVYGSALVAMVVLLSLAFVVVPKATGASSLPTSDANTFVTVNAHDWAYTVTYANGTSSTNVFWMPQNAVVELNVTSADTEHTFSIPSLGINVDAQPGVVNHFTFQLPSGTAPGTRYQFLCEIPCGSGHMSMNGWLVVTSADPNLPQ
ncbi:MAG TPA: DoxX family membrane protein [Thermoplasmata archaeon]|nr:DoxX family membrane protein [Thermoplasmata archaeon]